MGRHIGSILAHQTLAPPPSNRASVLTVPSISRAHSYSTEGASPRVRDVVLGRRDRGDGTPTAGGGRDHAVETVHDRRDLPIRYVALRGRRTFPAPHRVDSPQRDVRTPSG